MLQVKKQIKSGRDLCQFSSGDLEAKLGIKHILHRKKVFIFDMIFSLFYGIFYCSFQLVHVI